jgi:polyphosphate kinase
VLIDREIAHARRGAPAHLVLKMNALTDPQAIAALCRASEAGVQIDLIVRGVCILRPGVPGLSSRVRIRSVVGRFLEHSRVWWFANGGEEELFIGSADLMPRNFDRRVEVMVPVTTPALARRVRDEVLRLQLADPAAYELYPDGSYRRPTGQPPSAGCQAQLVARYAPAHAVSGSGPATDTQERTDTA